MAASIASWAIALRPTSVTAARMLRARSGPRAGGGVGVAQQVGGQALVGLERRDHVADAGVLALGDRLDAAHRGAEHGQPAELLDGVGEPMLGARCTVAGAVGVIGANHEALRLSVGRPPGPVLRDNSPVGRATAASGPRARLAAMRPFEGLLTAMVTPVQGGRRRERGGGGRARRHLLANGSDGLVVCGTTGESPTLSDDEMVALVTTMVEELGDEAPIVAGAGSNDTRHAAHLAERMAGDRRARAAVGHRLLQPARTAAGSSATTRRSRARPAARR